MLDCSSDHSPETTHNSYESDNVKDEDIHLVRKGICHELAKGTLPKLGSVTSSTTDTSKSEELKTNSDERGSVSIHEQDLLKKFQAIIDDLCYNPNNCEGWFNAGQCIRSKAEVINDRLPSMENSYKPSDFYVSPGKLETESGSKLAFAELVQKQEKDYNDSKKN
eukprot:14898494-Ditylum_brightwellii.AAC.1